MTQDDKFDLILEELQHIRNTLANGAPAKQKVLRGPRSESVTAALRQLLVPLQRGDTLTFDIPEGDTASSGTVITAVYTISEQLGRKHRTMTVNPSRVLIARTK